MIIQQKSANTVKPIAAHGNVFKLQMKFSKQIQ